MTVEISRSRRSVVGLSAAAVVLALGAGLMQPLQTLPATAQVARGAALSQAQLPSFADVVEEVRGAVVSVRATSRVVQVQDNDGFELPPGHPLERFCAREPAASGERGERPRGRGASARARASSSRPMAMP